MQQRYAPWFIYFIYLALATFVRIGHAWEESNHAGVLTGMRRPEAFYCSLGMVVEKNDFDLRQTHPKGARLNRGEYL